MCECECRTGGLIIDSNAARSTTNIAEVPARGFLHLGVALHIMFSVVSSDDQRFALTKYLLELASADHLWMQIKADLKNINIFKVCFYKYTVRTRV